MKKWNEIPNANFGRESDCVMIWLSGTWLLSNCLWLNLVKWRSFQDYVWQCKEVWYKHVTISDRRSTTVESNQSTYDCQSRDSSENFEIGQLTCFNLDMLKFVYFRSYALISADFWSVFTFIWIKSWNIFRFMPSYILSKPPVILK